MSFGHLRTLTDYGVLKITHFPDGGYEIVGRCGVVPENPAFSASPAEQGNSRSGASREERDAENRERARRRRVQRVRHAIRMAQSDRLLTLTYRENMVDFDRLISDWKRFSRALRAQGEFSFVAVPEKQSRGAWHIHIAIKGYRDVVAVRRLWHKIVSSGSVNIVYRKGSRSTWASAKLASYLSKYLGKTFGFEHLTNRKRFFCSRGLVPEIEIQTYSSLPFVDILCELAVKRPELDRWFVSSPRGVFWSSA